jgi:hypothetical protein
MTNEIEPQELRADEVLAVLVQMNGGEIEVPVQAFVDADIANKYLAIKERDEYTKMVIVLVDEQEPVDLDD